MNGISFPFPCVYLDSDELQKIISGINSAYHTKYAGKKFAMHRSVDLEGNYCIYYFENHGFSDYNIVEKIYD
jgi:hypothetical protein